MHRNTEQSVTRSLGGVEDYIVPLTRVEERAFLQRIPVLRVESRSQAVLERRLCHRCMPDKKLSMQAAPPTPRAQDHGSTPDWDSNQRLIVSRAPDSRPMRHPRWCTSPADGHGRSSAGPFDQGPKRTFDCDRPGTTVYGEKAMYRQTSTRGWRQTRQGRPVDLGEHLLPTLVWGDEIQRNVQIRLHGKQVRHPEQSRVDRRGAFHLDAGPRALQSSERRRSGSRADSPLV